MPKTNYPASVWALSKVHQTYHNKTGANLNHSSGNRETGTDLLSGSHTLLKSWTCAPILLQRLN